MKNGVGLYILSNFFFISYILSYFIKNIDDNEIIDIIYYDYYVDIVLDTFY
jgi:hypothetical protein